MDHFHRSQPIYHTFLRWIHSRRIPIRSKTRSVFHFNDWLHALPVMGHEFYDTSKVSTLRELLSVNFNELRDVTLLALSHLVHSYFHM